MADLVTLNGWLAEANLARHRLVTGQQTVTVSYDGKSVSYAQADLYKLEAYIADLNRQIAALNGIALRRGPVHFSF